MGPDAGSARELEGEAARDRLLALLAEMAEGAVADGRRGSGRPGDRSHASTGPVPFLLRVCDLAMAEVGVSGAGVTVMGSVADGIAGRRDQVAAGGGRSRQLEDLQLTAGHGPCLDAFAAGAPVLVGDLEADVNRWPGFAPEALSLGVAAVFSLPLQVGAVQLGTFDLYRTAAGPLAPPQLLSAVMLAGLVTETLLEHADDGEGVEDAGWLADVHAEVHQASGIVSVTEGIGVGEALVRIRAYAYAHGNPLGEVAGRIIARDLVLSDHDA